MDPTDSSSIPFVPPAVVDSYICDEEGYFHGVAGHVEPTALALVILWHTGMTMGELVEAPAPGGATPERMGEWSSKVVQGWWKVIDRDDPDTWDDQTREAIADDYWPWNWDRTFLVCGEDDPRAQPATYWQEG